LYARGALRNKASCGSPVNPVTVIGTLSELWNRNDSNTAAPRCQPNAGGASSGVS
jgi:hypothetical protein